MIDSVAGGSELTVGDLMIVATEAQRAKEETQRLEIATAELARTARQLREANDKLTALSVQEGRLSRPDQPRAAHAHDLGAGLSEILRTPDLSPEERDRFARIIYDEAGRPTRLLDDLLDLSALGKRAAVGRPREPARPDRARAVGRLGHAPPSGSSG